MIGNKAIKTGLVATILFCWLLETSKGAHLQINEIRFKSFTPWGGFTLNVRSDGNVEYEGKGGFVKVEGKRRTRISQDDFSRLVKKIEKIRFFDLNARYDRGPLGVVATDQSTEIVTVVAANRSKSVEDYMGAPKGLYELEQLILDVSQAAKWVGYGNDLGDVPYYESDSFRLNRHVTFRALLEHYSKGDEPKKIAGYLLMFMNNKGIDFHLEAPRGVDLQKFDGYIVDVTGYIKQKIPADYVFVVSEVKPVRRYP